MYEPSLNGHELPESLTRPLSKKARRREKRKSEGDPRTPGGKEFKPLNQSQRDYFHALRTCDQVFAIGEAGTGKTYIAARWAAKQLAAKQIESIKIARPLASRERHKTGFLPGSLNQKLRPWFMPVIQALKEEMSGTVLDKMMNEGKVEFLSFEHMRGATFKDCVVILDEAQNCDLGDLKLFLTRLGEGCQVIVCGDPTQSDIPDSGLDAVLDMIEECDVDAAVIEFMPEDVVRSEAARQWVMAFDRVQRQKS